VRKGPGRAVARFPGPLPCSPEPNNNNSGFSEILEVGTEAVVAEQGPDGSHPRPRSVPGDPGTPMMLLVGHPGGG